MSLNSCNDTAIYIMHFIKYNNKKYNNDINKDDNNTDCDINDNGKEIDKINNK